MVLKFPIPDLRFKIQGSKFDIHSSEKMNFLDFTSNIKGTEIY